MRRFSVVALAFAAFALPAAAQQAAPSNPTDWSKPVVGVDHINGLTTRMLVPADQIIPVEVYTIEDLRRESGATTEAVVNALQTQPPNPPCNPDRKPSADGKSQVLSVCPAEPPAKAQ